jgi:dTMP kinase
LQLLFSADRAFHLEKEIVPLLEKGVFVVCDRYAFSTLAFGNFQINDLEWLVNLQKRFLLPDLTFFLKVSPEVCIQRIAKTRFETTLFEKQEVLAKVWQNYEQLAKMFDNIYIINGEQTIEKVFEDIKKIVNQKIYGKHS